MVYLVVAKLEVVNGEEELIDVRLRESLGWVFSFLGHNNYNGRVSFNPVLPQTSSAQRPWPQGASTGLYCLRHLLHERIPT